MVKDEFSDNNHRPPLSTDGFGRHADDELLRSPAENLTQRLAQLLTASIAQNQANKGNGRIPTNAELINLANLLLAAAARRTPEPAFKDGLLTLSDVEAPQVSRHQQSAAASPVELSGSYEPVPIPSPLSQPFRYEDEYWFRHQVGSAVVGLITGLLIVVPTVLWLSGFFGPQQSGSTTARASAPAIESNPSTAPTVEDVRTVTVEARPVEQNSTSEKPSDSAAHLVIGTFEQRPAQPFETKPMPLPVIPVNPTTRLEDPTKTRIEELLAQASQRIESGDLIGAREMLAGADDGTQGAVLFALAETYDPNMLAAWGILGAVSNAAKARELYEKAAGLGVAPAHIRLDDLR
jgi:hypothetical protein